MKRSTWWSPMLLMVVLSPVFLQSDCNATGDPTLSSLELEAGGINRVIGFDPSTQTYNVWLDGATTMDLSVVTTDPGSTMRYILGPQAVQMGQGTGQATISVPAGPELLGVAVFAPGGASFTYILSLNPPCTGPGECDDADSCTSDACNTGTSTCEFTPVCTQPITVAAGWNVDPTHIILPYTLEVRPTSQINANQPFTADLGGTVELPEFLLDFFQLFLTGGVADIVLVDLKATVQTRGGGATGADVALGIDESALVPGPTRFCTLPPDQTCTADVDCIVPPCNPPVNVVGWPISTDCAPAGLCESLGKATQCSANGFCITGSLLLPLEPVLGASYMAGDGVTPGQTEALFGWADNPPPVTAVGVPPLDPDGTWNMIMVSYGGGVAGELGIRLIMNGNVFVAFEGVMAVDSNGPDGVGVPGDASPTPDSALISFPVVVP